MTKCGSCGHENDPTRVFCQNCGQRLERAGNAPAGPTHTPVPVKGKTIKPKGPGLGSAVWKFFRGIISTAFLAALLAAGIQASRAPDGLPEKQPTNPGEANSFYATLKTFSESRYPRTLVVKQDQVNNYLAVNLAEATATAEGGWMGGAKFGRALVVFEAGAFQFFVERRVMGYPVYVGVDGTAAAGAGGVTAMIKRGTIGRLPVHPVIMRVIESRIIGSVTEALAEPLQVLHSVNKLTLEPGGAALSWSGQEPVR